MAAIASDSQTTGKDFQSDGGCQWNFTDSDLMKTLDSMEIYGRQPDDKSSTSSEYLMQEFFPNYKINQSQIAQATPILPQYPEIYGQPTTSTTVQQPTLQPEVQPVLQSVLQPISSITEDVNPVKGGTIFSSLDSSPFPVTCLNHTNSLNQSDISIRSEGTIIQRLDVPNMVPNLVQETSKFRRLQNPENVLLSCSSKILQNPLPYEDKSAKPVRPRGRPRIYDIEPSNCHEFCMFNVKDICNKRKLKQTKMSFKDLEAISSEPEYEYSMSCSLDIPDDIGPTFNIFSFPSFNQKVNCKQISPTSYAKNESAYDVEAHKLQIPETGTPICSVTLGEVGNPLPKAPLISSNNLAAVSVNKRSKKKVRKGRTMPSACAGKVSAMLSAFVNVTLISLVWDLNFVKTHFKETLMKQVTPDKKTGEYWVKRQKNNESAKRSRDARRFKENQIYIRTKLLERMCAKLSRDFQEARKQIDVLKQRLVKYEMQSTAV